MEEVFNEDSNNMDIVAYMEMWTRFYQLLSDTR